ncbi:BspA family leucine-rich repeat surface protein [Winogradskyella sp. SYSU M77433]|uniref:BspA family leucine-rich repeat surface protein n=1 Tax=Winogradskyella sp. SYSU M77433 TaxID=3042722 RepID=UPI0024806DC8|nr:BspA family leucine-rich repeat surface protein [Winogradskyella sp. SYSU M77433]MDH7911339.1 BspA family leucine-rich repeat surface protein [Winogradskyella sp. SYSU M77433]
MRTNTNKGFWVIIFLISQSHFFAQTSENDFVTTWKTDNPSTLDNLTIKIPVLSNSFTYNYDVDWNNDGVFDDLGVTDEISHSYSVPGTYTVRIRGQFPSIIINNDTDVEEKIISVEQWGNIQWGSMLAAFKGAKNLTINATDTPDLSNVDTMYAMFEGAISFNQNINSWDVSTIEKMQFVFHNATSFNQPLDNWNVGNVDNMQEMFSGATSFNQNIDSWDVGNVANMKEMFFDAESFDQPLNSWDVSSVTNMEKMFAFTAPPPFGGPSFNTFNHPIDQWNVSNVTNMRGMFQYSQSFNQPLNDWDVSSVNFMYSMFWSSDSFNQPLDNWDVSNVTDMGGMFALTESFNQPLNNWDVSSVVFMDYMFDFADVFNQPLDNWNVENVTTMERMFTGLTLSTEYYDATLNSWANQSLQSNVEFHGGNSNYCNSETARNTLIDTYGWTITDGGLDCSGLNIEELLVENIDLYPNPTEGIINIESPSYINIDTIEIYTLSGQPVGVANFGNKQMNLENLKSGIYFIKLIYDKRYVIKKIVKQ